MKRLDGLARTLGRVARGATLAGRTVFPVDTNPVPAEWTHVTKVDPEEAKKLPLLYPLYLQHTSAVSVGGSADVTAQNTEETFDLLAPASVPVFHEPSGPRHVTPETREQADLLAIPEVLNGDAESLVGQLGAGVEYVHEEMVPELLATGLPWLPDRIADPLADFATSWLLAEAVFEAYVIQNPASAAAREANVSEADLLDPTEAKQRAMAAERHLESELVYLEYSGTYGGREATEMLAAMADGLSWSRLWYGGGLDSRERAEAMLDAGADAIVVGDVFHRIADEEADVCERAGRTLDSDSSTARVREWVGEHVAIADSSAAAYLATIPSVDDPERRAERYLTATIRTLLGLQALCSDELDHANPSSVTLDGLLGADARADLDPADAELMGQYLGALGDELDGTPPSAEREADDRVSTNHFAPARSVE